MYTRTHTCASARATAGYDKAAELKQGYIALGAMLGSCALFSIFAAWNMSGGNPCGGGGQVEPSRGVAAAPPRTNAPAALALLHTRLAGAAPPPQPLPTNAAVAEPAAPPAPAFATDPLEAPPPYHPSMGVQYDGVKTSAL